MLRSYLPAIVFVLLGAGVGGAFAVLNTYIGPRRGPKIQSKGDPYECGLPSEVHRGFRFGISFYLIAMLFILFDIEVVFLYPVAIQLRAAARADVGVDHGEDAADGRAEDQEDDGWKVGAQHRKVPCVLPPFVTS